MFKRIISLTLCILLLFISGAVVTSCSADPSQNQFPVTVGNVTIEKEPKNIVVLSDNLADIISLIGYDVKMVGRSVETDQDFLKIVPAVGSASTPNVGEIVNYETDLVIADSTLSSGSISQLEEQNIPVLQLESAKTTEELKQLYIDLGTALGGRETGAEKGQDAYDDLFDTLDTFKSVVKTNTIKTCCYVYLENNMLKTLEQGTLENTIFSYNSALNIFNDRDTKQITTEMIKLSTPTYIFVSDEQTKAFLENDENLKNSACIRSGNVYIIPLKNFYRQGQTYIDTVYEMTDIMFVKGESTPDEASTAPSGTTSTDETMASETVKSTEKETGIVADYGEVNFEDDEADIIGGDN